jgi:DNA-binding NarL/FixJ family response regulator
MRQGGMRIGDIARWFETSRPNVEAILYGRSWNHVTGIPLPIVKPPSERRPKNKLTSGQVREILALIASGITKKDIAIRMGVSEGTILKIDQGKTWRPFLARIAKENPESETGENSV